MEPRHLLSTVSILAPKPNAGEQLLSDGSSDNGEVTISLDAVASQDLTVKFQLGGAAIYDYDTPSNGDYLLSSNVSLSSEYDYNTYSYVTVGSVVIPSGQSSVAVDLTPVNDDQRESAETVVLTLVTDDEGCCCCGGGDYTLGSPSSASLTIADNDNWTVAVQATDAYAVEHASNDVDPGQFQFSRSGETDLAHALPVNFKLQGTAIYDYDAPSSGDYTFSPNVALSTYYDYSIYDYVTRGTVLIPAGQTSVIVDLAAVLDDETEPSETAVATLLDDAAGGCCCGEASYTVGSPSTASITIADAPPEISLRTLDEYGYEQEISDDSGNVSLGTTTVGVPVDKSFTIYNIGDGVLTLDPTSLTWPAGFSLVSSYADTVAAGGSTTFTLRLNAVDGGQFHGTVSFNSNDEDENPFGFWLYGEVDAPQPEISVRSLDSSNIEQEIYDGSGSAVFDTTSLGTPVDKTFTIYNTGDGVLMLDPASLTYPAFVTLVTPFAETVAAGGNTDFTLRLGAAMAGNFSGTVSFASNDLDESVFDFAISGEVTGGPANRAPTVANPIADLTVDEDASSTTIALADVFDDEDLPLGDEIELAVSANDGPTLVSTSLTDTTLTLTYAADQNGVVHISVRATDTQGESAEDEFVVTVNPVNDPPEAGPDTYSPSHDQVLSITALQGVLANDTDAEGDGLTASLVDAPAHGVLVLAADGSFDYTPETGFLGEDSFSYQASDGTAASAVTLVTLEVVNHPPVAAADDMTVAGNACTFFSASDLLDNDDDLDDDSLAVTVVSTVAHGTLTLNTDGAMTYIPVHNYVGSDSFTYSVSDGLSESNLATVVLHVLTPAPGTNFFPTVVNDSYSLVQDSTLTVSAAGVLANDSDADNDPLTAFLQTGPSHGTLTYLNADGSFQYIPNAGYVGGDSFTYGANDGLDDSNAATVTLNVDASPPSPNQAPTANNDSYSMVEGSTLIVPADGVLANDNDPESDPLTAALQVAPTHGTLTYLNADGAFEYVPNADFTGTETFSYVANDGTDASNVATVTIDVTAAGGDNAEPMIATAIVDRQVETNSADLILDLFDVFIDPDPGDELAFSVSENTNSGVVAATVSGTGLLILTFAEDQIGTAVIRVRATDDEGAFVEDVFQVDVVAHNLTTNPPIVVNDSGDAIEPDGYITLREAIEQANTTPGPDVIQFDLPPNDRIIGLSQSQPLTITSSLRIVGPTDGAALTVALAATNASHIRLFAVHTGSVVAISDMMIRGGDLATGDGGAIWNSGELTLSRVTVAQNTAALGHGGGIFNASSGTLLITDSTVSGNVSLEDGGGIYNSGTASLVNVTVAENSTMGAGAGIRSAGATSLRNTLVATNTGAADTEGPFTSEGHNLVGDGGAATGFDLAGLNGDMVGGVADAPIVDPHLGPLQDNGGAAWTHQLLVDSPAIDAGDNAFVAQHDQRYAPRILDGPDAGNVSDASPTIDIGAYEFSTFFVNTDLDGTDTTPLGDGRVDTDPATPGDQISLRGAIQELNSLAGWDGTGEPVINSLDGHILFSRSIDTEFDARLSINGAGEDLAAMGDLDVFGMLTIRGRIDEGGNRTTRIDAEGTTEGFVDRIFHIHPDSHLRFESIVVTGGYLVDDATADSLRGAVILNDGSTLELLNAEMSVADGTALTGEAHQGGVLYTRGGDVLFSHSTLSLAWAETGGVAYVESGNLVIEDSKLSTASARLRGGGVFLESGTLAIHRSELSHLLAVERGGAIYNLGGSVHITDNSVLAFNGSGECLADTVTVGGAVYNAESLLIDGGAVLEANHANHGGGVYNSGDLTIRDAKLLRNLAASETTGRGGAVYNAPTGSTIIERTAFRENNSAWQGNAVFNDNGSVTIIESTITRDLENTDHIDYGNNIYNHDLDAKLTVIDTQFDGAPASGITGGIKGADIWNAHGTVNVLGSTFADSWGMASMLGPEIGASIVNFGEHRYLGRTPQHSVSLASAINASQSVVFLSDASVLQNATLPFDIRIGEERMAVTEIDWFRDALIVERDSGQSTSHSSSEAVRLVIGPEQQYLTLASSEALSRYQLPLDVIVDYEVMTIVSVEGDVAQVERGRRGSIAVEHEEPVELWGIAGAVAVTDCTFSDNHSAGSGSAIFNHINPFVPPTIVENSTFSGSSGEPGTSRSIATDISNNVFWNTNNAYEGSDHFYIPPMSGEIDIFPGFETPIVGWQPTLPDDIEFTPPDTSLYIKNSVFHGDSEMVDIGGIHLDIKKAYEFDPGYDISPSQDAISAEARNDYPETPFGLTVSHYDESGELQHEAMLVTEVGVDEFGAPALKVDRGNGGVDAIWHYGELIYQFTIEGGAEFADSVVSGGYNYVSADSVSRTVAHKPEIWTTAPTSELQTSFDVEVVNDFVFPDTPFSITVNHVDSSTPTLSVEEMLVTEVLVTPGQSVGQLVVQRGVVPLAHPAFSTITTQLSRQWNPGAIDSLQTEFDVLVPEEGFPTATPFVIRVSHIDDVSQELVHERMVVTDIITEPNEPIARLKVDRPEAIDHPAYAVITTSLTGFWLPSDQYGSLDELSLEHGSLVSDPNGIDAAQTTLHVVDPEELPAVPFVIQVAGFGSEPAEHMQVTGVEGNALTVERGEDGTTAAAHPAHAKITWRSPLSFQIDPRLGALGDNGGPTETQMPLPDSPVLDTPAETGYRHVNTTQSLAANYGTKTALLLDVDPNAAFTRIALDECGSEIVVQDASVLPPAPFFIRIDREIMEVSQLDLAENTLTVQRGYGGTEASGHEYDSLVYHGQLISEQSETIQVLDTSEFPPTPFIVQADQERMLVTTVDSDNAIVTVERGAYGTTSTSHDPHAELKQGHLIEVTDTADFTRTPFLVHIESEHLYVVDIDYEHDLVEIERGANRTLPFAHDPGSMSFVPDGYAAGFYGAENYTNHSRTERFFDTDGDGISQVDLGAGESLRFVVDTLFDEPDLIPGNGAIDTSSGYTSLRAAVMEMSTFASSGTIILPAGTYSLDSQLTVSSKMRIIGENAQTTILSTSGADRVITVADAGDLELSNVTLSDGNTSSFGGAILVDGGSLRLQWSVVSSSSATQGGAVHNAGGSLEIINCTLSDNSATLGGAVSAVGGDTLLAGATVSGNTASNLGGGVWLAPATKVTILNSTIAENSASDGGGIRSDGTTHIANSIVATNISADGADTKGTFNSLGYNLIGSLGPSAGLTDDTPESETQFSVEDGSIFPETPFEMLVGDVEVVLVTEIDVNTLTVERARDNTNAAYHFNGTVLRWDGFYHPDDQTSDYGPLDPMLGPLGVNDGIVPTHAIAANSPALDQGNESQLHGIQLELGRTIGWFYEDSEYDRIFVDRWGLVPAKRSVIKIGDLEYVIDGVDYDRLQLATPEDHMVRRGTSADLLTDARGAPRYIGDPMGTTDRLDIGAFERVSEYSIDQSVQVQPEGTDSQPTVYQFAVTRSGRLNDWTHVHYTVRKSDDESADGDDFHDGIMDYGTIEFLPGETLQTIEVLIAGDSRLELDEHFLVELVDPSPGGRIIQSTGSGTIVDDDTASLEISSPSTVEGNLLVFDLTVNGGVQGGFKLDWTVTDGTATQTDQDYCSAAGTASFAGTAGETIRVYVNSISDNTIEADETVQLSLSNLHDIPAELANLLTVPETVEGTILNNDESDLIIEDAQIIEGDSGQHSVEFTVRLTPNPNELPISANIATSDLTAEGGVDYLDTAGSINHSGQAADSVSFYVPIVGDLDVEMDEQFSVSLASIQAGGNEANIGVVGATATIIDDDTPTVIVRNAWVTEGNVGTASLVFDVMLLNPLGPVTVDISAAGSGVAAAANTDFDAALQTLSFSGVDGETLTYSVAVFSDNVVELDETLTATLTNLQAAGNESFYRLIDGIGTVWNDDAATLQISGEEQVYEYDGKATFTVTLQGDVDVPFTVTMATPEPTSIGDAYFGPTVNLSFSGTTGQTLHYDIALRNDRIDNPTDLIAGASIIDVQASGRNVSPGGTATVTVLDDEDLTPSEYAEEASSEEDDSLSFLDCAGSEVWVSSIRPPSPEYELENPIYITHVRAYLNPDEPASVPGYADDNISELLAYADGVLSVDGVRHIVPLKLIALQEVDPWAIPHEGFDGYFAQTLVEVQGVGFHVIVWQSPPPDWSFYDGDQYAMTAEEAYEKAIANRGTCELNVPREQYVPPPPEVKADWVVPHTGSLTFNPFPTFNYRLAQQVALTIDGTDGFAEIGSQVTLQYGTVTVNPDFTLTYEPADDLMDRTDGARLQPEADENGNIFRYTGIESFEAYIVNLNDVTPASGEGEAGTAPISYASVPVELAISNHLPVLRGDRLHENGASGDTFSLDSPIFVDYSWDTSGEGAARNYRLDFRELFIDPDGEQDLAKLEILDVQYGGRSLNEDDPDTPDVDEDAYKEDIRVKIGERTIGAMTHDRELIVRRPAGTTILDIYNPVSRDDVQAGADWSSGPSQLTFTVILTDGQPSNEPELDEDGEPKTDPQTGATIYKLHQWKVNLDVRPNNSDLSSSQWITTTAAPKVDFRPWLSEVIPPIDPNYDPDPATAPPILSENWRVTAMTESSLDTHNSEVVGGTVLDLYTGTFQRAHELALDGSGGASEMAIPGLLYDSSVVHVDGTSMPVVQAVVEGDESATSITAELKWYNQSGPVTSSWTAANPGQAQHVIALSPPAIDDVTGVYGWELTVNISDGTDTTSLRTAGETPVIVGDQTAIFGAGWTLAGVPWIWIDTRDEDDTLAANRAYDDRIVMGFPGEAPKVFNAMELTLNNFSFAGTLNSLQPGSTEVSYDGFADPQEFGTLTSRQNPDELVYDDGTGKEYVFKKYSFDGQTTYLIDRIEQPGVEYDTSANAWPAGRRGVSIEWDDTSYPHPVLAAIEATDGMRTEFGYDASGYLASERLVDGAATLRETQFTVNGNRELAEIRHEDGSNDRVRVFEYDNGLMTKDQWYDDDPSDPTKLARHTEFAYSGGRLSEIQLGDGLGADQNTITYQITPAGLEPDLVGRVAIDVPDLAKYDEASDGETTIGGTYETTYEFSLDGLLERQIEYYDGFELSRETWSYDQIGFVKSHTDPLGQETVYWHDYETPVAYSTTDPDDGNADAVPKYDPNDYRGNITFVITPAGLTRYEYETDDEAMDAIGHLVRQVDKPVIDANGDAPQGGTSKEVVTEYELDDQGRVLLQRTIRGEKDPETLPSDFAVNELDRLESWTYNSMGRVASHTDPRGLTTNYTYDSHRRLETAAFTDQGIDPLDVSDDQTVTTAYSYDTYGNLDRTVVYNGSTTDNVVSIRDVDYDPTGLLSQDRTLTPDESALSRTGYEYAPDGTVTAVIDGNGVRTESTYDRAGLLVEFKEAASQTHYSLYTGQQESIEQTTTYAYYADGSLRQTNRPGNIAERVYVDPANRTQWTTTNGVSDGAHTIDPITYAITFNVNGTRVLKNEVLELGRESRNSNLATGGQVTHQTPTSGLDTLNQIVVGQPGQELKSSTKYDARGNPLLREFSDRGPQQMSVDQFGNTTQSANLVNEQINISNTTNAAGDLVEMTEIEYSPIGFLADDSQPIPASSWFSTAYVTTYQYDQQGRLRKTIDPLTDGDSTVPDETGAIPATVGYSFDPDNNAVKVTSTSRTGVATAQWFDAAGRLVQKQNSLGEVTKYEYDNVGNKTATKFFKDATASLLISHTSFEYDALGRLRVTKSHIDQPSFTATDYFLPGAAGADGWNVVEFIPLHGTDPATYSDPNIKGLATKTRTDSLGNVYYAQRQDPSDKPNDTPTTLITYSYLPELYATATTTRLSVADNVDASTSPNISPFVAADPADPTADSNEQVRVTRVVTDANGAPILYAQRLSGFANSDAVIVGTPHADGYSHFVDAGFFLLERGEYDADTGQLTKVFKGKDSNGDDRVDTLGYHEATGLVKVEFDSNGSSNYFQYNSFNALAGQMNQSGEFTTQAYDALGRPTIAQDFANGTTEVVYAGNTTITHGPLGNDTQHTVDPSTGQIETRDALGNVTVSTVGSAGTLLAQADSLGNATMYEYDSQNRLVKVTDASSGETTLGYDLAGNVVSHKDALQNEIQYEYDTLGRKIKETQPDPDGAGPLPAPVTKFEYDVAGNVVKQIRVIDPATSPDSDRVTAFEYDTLNRKVKETLPDPDGDGPLDSPVIQFEYDVAGNLAKVTDPLGRETLYEYDILSRKVKETLPDPDGAGPLTAPMTQFVYDAAGNVEIVVDAQGETVYEYDAFGRKTKQTLPDPDGGGPLDAPVTQYEYDAAGNLTKEIDPEGRERQYEYDDLNRKIKETLPDPDGGGPLDSPVTRFAYDATGNLTKMTDPLGEETTYEYDTLGRKITESLPDPDGDGPLDSPVIQYTYDAVGNRTSLTDPAGNTTTWAYDALSRVTEETNELGDTRYFVYDPAGNLAQRTSRDGRIIEYDYDNLDRTIQERWIEGGVTVRTMDFAYDAASQLISAADPAATITNTYDDLGRIASATQNATALGFDVVLTGAYDDVGNRTQLAATVAGNADFVTDYTYDALNRMTQIEQHSAPGGSTVAEKRIDLAYDAVGQFTTITRFEDLAATLLVATSDYTYDDAGRLTGLTHAQGTTPLADYGWTYDAAGRVTQFTSATDGTSDYTYDVHGQLTDATHVPAVAGLPTVPPDESHTYDANGNRTDTGYTTGTNNQTTSDGAYNYDYDAEGNRTRRTDTTTGEVTEYTWDHRNRLTKIIELDSLGGNVTKTVEYTYDAFNRRIAKAIDDDGDGPDLAETTFFVYDGDRESRENAGDHIVLQLDDSGNVTNRYLHGPAVDQVLADEDDLGEVLWPLADNLGTIRDIAVSDGTTTTIVNHITYDAFGLATSEQNLANPAAQPVDHIFGFTGREIDDESDLNFYRARYYDPSVARFISQDPIGFEAGDANVYRYVGNGPTNATDPSGLQPPGPFSIGGYNSSTITGESYDPMAYYRNTEMDFSGRPNVPRSFLPIKPHGRKTPQTKVFPLFAPIREAISQCSTYVSVFNGTAKAPTQFRGKSSGELLTHLYRARSGPIGQVSEIIIKGHGGEDPANGIFFMLDDDDRFLLQISTLHETIEVSDRNGKLVDVAWLFRSLTTQRRELFPKPIIRLRGCQSAGTAQAMADILGNGAVVSGYPHSPIGIPWTLGTIGIPVRYESNNDED
jgi:RHS repeat-associated protein